MKSYRIDHAKASQVGLALFFVSITALLVGCSQSENNDSGAAENLPESYKSAVAEIASLRDTIQKSADAGTLADDHEPLHQVGELLESLPDEAATASLSSDQQAVVKAKSDELFELFGKVDAKFHGEEGVDYADVAEEIDAAIAALTDLNSASGSPPSE